MRRLIIAGAVIALAMGSVPAGADGPQVEEYVVGEVGDLFALCTEYSNGVVPVNVGGACFDVPAGSGSVSITIEDTVNGSFVGWWFRQRPACDEYPACVLEAGGFQFAGCEPGVIGLSPSTALLEISLDGMGYGLQNCPPTGFATISGTITAGFAPAG